MRKKSGPQKATTEQVVKDIRRKTRKAHSAEEKNRIVLEGLRGEENSASARSGKFLGLLWAPSGHPSVSLR